MKRPSERLGSASKSTVGYKDNVNIFSVHHDRIGSKRNQQTATVCCDYSLAEISSLKICRDSTLCFTYRHVLAPQLLPLADDANNFSMKSKPFVDCAKASFGYGAHLDSPIHSAAQECRGLSLQQWGSGDTTTTTSVQQ